MSSASVIIEGIIMIAAIITASIFASSFLVKIMEMSDVMNSIAKGYKEKLRTHLMIIYATYLNTSNSFVVYARNIGESSIFIKRLSIYFGNNVKLDLYVYDYDGSPEPGEWYYDEVDGVSDGIWNPGETLAIYICNVTSIKPPYIVKIVTPSGYKIEETFAPIT